MKCHRCKNEIQETDSSITTGYGNDKDGNPICYPCWGEIDKEWMVKHGKITLYLTRGNNEDVVCNWPGSLMFLVKRLRTGRHNIAGTQTHVWFTGPEGKTWWGRQYGRWSELCHCKRLGG
jgi:hypothetical protein